MPPNGRSVELPIRMCGSPVEIAHAGEYHHFHASLHVQGGAECQADTVVGRIVARTLSRMSPSVPRQAVHIVVDEPA
jgi:hypothetical protein